MLEFGNNGLCMYLHVSVCLCVYVCVCPSHPYYSIQNGRRNFHIMVNCVNIIYISEMVEQFSCTFFTNFIQFIIQNWLHCLFLIARVDGFSDLSLQPSRYWLSHSRCGPKWLKSALWQEEQSFCVLAVFQHTLYRTDASTSGTSYQNFKMTQIQLLWLFQWFPIISRP